MPIVRHTSHSGNNHGSGWVYSEEIRYRQTIQEYRPEVRSRQQSCCRNKEKSVHVKRSWITDGKSVPVKQSWTGSEKSIRVKRFWITVHLPVGVYPYYQVCSACQLSHFVWLQEFLMMVRVDKNESVDESIVWYSCCKWVHLWFFFRLRSEYLGLW